MSKKQFMRFMVFNVLMILVTGMVASALAANAYAYHPEVILYATLDNKIVYPGRSIFEYKDDQGLSSILPFERRDENITISFANIVFSKEFENKSIALATESVNSALSATKDVLTSNGLEYIYIKITNKTALSTATYYSVTYTLEIPDEPAISADDYLLGTVKADKTGDNLQFVEVQIKFTIVDTGANTRYLILSFKTDVSDSISAPTDSAQFTKNVQDNTYTTLQVKIADLLEGAGVSWTPAKLTNIEYLAAYKTGSTLDSESTLEAYIRHAIITSSKVYIDDPAYENGLVVNGTSGDFTATAGDVIQLYGANCTKIVNVDIPFMISSENALIKKDYLAEKNGFYYEWEFSLPKTTTAEADTLSYTGTNLTLKSWMDGSYFTKLYMNGVDKLSSVTGKTVDTSTGLDDVDRAWTYALATSLTAGNLYSIKLQVEDLPLDIVNALTESPIIALGWLHPKSWVYAFLLFWEKVLYFITGGNLMYHWARKWRVAK